MSDGDDNNKPEEMVPFFSVASRDFDRDLDILKKYCTSLNNEHILKMHTYSAKELQWQQDGGFTISSLSQILHKRFFNWRCHLAFLLIIKKPLGQRLLICFRIR